MLLVRTTLLSIIIVALLTSFVVAAKSPNVVLIISDDQAWPDFGFMGHKEIQTPHLDKLASQSAVFPNGYVPTSVCRPSLASIITGLYPHQHKICYNIPPDGVDYSKSLAFLQNVPTLPRLLKRAGYKSLQTGKFWEGHYSNGGFMHGMTTLGPHTGPGPAIGGKYNSLAGGPGLVIGRKTMQPIYDFIGECGDSPFFIWYAPFMPHSPHNPSERILKKYAVEGRDIRLAKYWAMCEWFDQTCGELFEYLERKDLIDNTLIVFIVDNGYKPKTRPAKSHRRLAASKKNRPSPDVGGPKAPIMRWLGKKSKLSPYDGGVRTPILISWPGHTKPGRYPDLVSAIDLAPTILAACGLKPTEQMPGLNLLDVAGGKSQLDRQAVFGEVFVHTALDLYEPARNLTHRWVREGDWKVIHSEGEKDSAELYNLAVDPTEENNLATTHPDKVRHLTNLLDEWWPGKPADRE